MQELNFIQINQVVGAANLEEDYAAYKAARLNYENAFYAKGRHIAVDPTYIEPLKAAALNLLQYPEYRLETLDPIRHLGNDNVLFSDGLTVVIQV